MIDLGGRKVKAFPPWARESILRPQGAPGRCALQMRLHFLKIDFSVPWGGGFE
jgi:hypothetical protein